VQLERQLNGGIIGGADAAFKRALPEQPGSQLQPLPATGQRKKPRSSQGHKLIRYAIRLTSAAVMYLPIAICSNLCTLSTRD